jgi:acyl-CoA thioesterase-1
MMSANGKWAVVLLGALAACGAPDNSGRQPRARRESASTESTSRGATAATASDGAETPATHTGAPRVLFLGTSLTAGYGLDDPGHDAYPSVLQRMADSAGVKANIVNAGLTGETSAGALRRVDWLLKQKPDLVVIETGANDGLRGLDPDSTAANLKAIVVRLRADNPAVKILLVQMEAPTNLGPKYTADFHALFGKVAAGEHVTLTPFLLDKVAGVAKLNQGDGIHPTPEGARIAAHNIWPVLARALGKVDPTH